MTPASQLERRPVGSFSPLVCRHCGSVPEAARVNPATGRPGRKCVECCAWEDVPAPFRRWLANLPADAR